MQIFKIFNSVESNGMRVGFPTTCIQTYSCNAGCSDCQMEYCISPDKIDEQTGNFTVMSVDELLDEIADNGNVHVALCGGEPLIQKDAPELVAALLDLGYKVTIHTQGVSELTAYEKRLVDILSDDEALNNLSYALEYKCPSSGASDNMLYKNVNFLIDNDALIFQIKTKEDLDFMTSVIDEFEPTAGIFAIPVGLTSQEIIDYILANNLQRVRLQLNVRP